MAGQISMNMRQDQTQSLKQTQRLMMSPQMQQAIHLLQVPVLELSAMLATEMEQNPLLEYADEVLSDSNLEALEKETEEVSQDQERPEGQELDFNDRDFDALRTLDQDMRDHFAESSPSYQRQMNQEEEKRRTFFETSLTYELSLFDYLMNQARQSFDKEEEIQFAEAIIGNLDENGFLKTDLEEIALTSGLQIKNLEAVLKEVQSFEPFGIAASSMRESLLIQLHCLNKGKSLAYRVIEKHYDDLLHNRIPLISKSLSCTPQDILEAVEYTITKLNLHPGAWHAQKVMQQITADVAVEFEEGNAKVEVNNDTMPALRLNTKYMDLLEDKKLPLETRDYIREKILSSKWLLRNIHQRNDTLLRVTSAIANRQKDFFIHPDGKLLPMTMKVVAEELSLHESTIARAVANKYVDCLRGLLPLRNFFTNAYANEDGEEISSNTVRDLLMEIIEEESKEKPFSDEEISKRISKRGVRCARRTVAKYRRELKIGNASQRRRFS